MTDITLPRAEVEQALEALLSVKNHGWDEDTHTGRALITTLRERLAQPEQEPYGYVSDDENLFFQKEKPEIGRWLKVFTAPPQRTWVDLTDEQIEAALLSVDPATKRLPPGMKAFARAVGGALKGENT